MGGISGVLMVSGGVEIVRVSKEFQSIHTENFSYWPKIPKII